MKNNTKEIDKNTKKEKTKRCLSVPKCLNSNFSGTQMSQIMIPKCLYLFNLRQMGACAKSRSTQMSLFEFISENKKVVPRCLKSKI